VVNDKVTRKVMYQQHKSYNTAIDIFSDFSLGWRRNYSGKGLAWLGGEGGSSCNAFAIATFSSYIIISFNELRFTLAHSIALYLPTSWRLLLCRLLRNCRGSRTSGSFISVVKYWELRHWSVSWQLYSPLPFCRT